MTRRPAINLTRRDQILTIAVWAIPFVLGTCPALYFIGRTLHGLARQNGVAP